MFCFFIIKKKIEEKTAKIKKDKNDKNNETQKKE